MRSSNVGENIISEDALHVNCGFLYLRNDIT